MRELIYGVEGKVANLRAFAVDESGCGGANHVYDVLPVAGNAKGLRIEFQNGPIKGGIVNGLQNEDLLAVLIDRLEGFQHGPFKCEENALALDALREAMLHLNTRTKKRIARGVEGTHAV